ncbi:MAG TPA: hypothetical protein VK013_08915 [Myxococcaceae bacterium]|nr:hypothetical protein [Myxococcaceae bacterium]
MKRLMAALVLLTMVGCGTDTTRSLDGPTAPPDEVAVPGTPVAHEPEPPEAPEPGVTQQGLRATLRLQGIGIGAYTAVLGQIRSVEVRVDGVEQEVRLERGSVDLARTGHAWKLATFTIPDGAREVSVALRFDDFGGYESSAGAGMVDLRVPPLRFSAPAENFIEHRHAVVHLDVARSLLDRGEGRLLLPSFQVHY